MDEEEPVIRKAKTFRVIVYFSTVSKHWVAFPLEYNASGMGKTPASALKKMSRNIDRHVALDLKHGRNPFPHHETNRYDESFWTLAKEEMPKRDDEKGLFKTTIDVYEIKLK